jgi:arginine/lysine/histidine transporter system substrate-binding protein
MIERRSVLRAGFGAIAAAFAGIPRGVAGQGDPVWDRVMREKKVRVHAVQFPPQTYRDQEGGEWKGFDADVFRYIARQLGVELEVVWTTTAAMIPTLTSGRSDLGVAVYRTPEREKVVDFTTPYKWVADHVIVHTDDRETSSLDQLKSKVIGAPRGTAEELAARKIHEAGYAREVRVYDTVDAMFRDLSVKRVDSVVYQTIYFQWVQAQNPDLKGRLAFEVDPKFFGRTERSPSQFPAYKGASQLIDAVNKVIVAMRENGEMARIFGKYGVTEPSVWTPPR